MKFHAFSASLILTFLVSCQSPSTEQSDYMAFENIKFVTEFPETFVLHEKKVPDVDIIGLKSFAIKDSILILNTANRNGIWSIYSLPNYTYFGRFLNRGEGPLEFMQGPSVKTNAKIIKEGDQLLAYLYDFQKGRLLKFDISESIASKELHLTILKDDLPPFLFNFKMIDNNSYFSKEISNSNTQQIRSIVENGEKKILPILNKLNEAAILEGEDVNILSTMTELSDHKNRFVEMPIGLNYINLYSLDSTIANTICIGESLVDISAIQREHRWFRTYTFADLCVFDDFFGVVFINQGEAEYQTARTKLPSIMLFDWEGNPLAELKLETHITSFDIDLRNQELYTFDLHSEEFFKFDVRDILIKLKSNNLSLGK